MKKYFLGIVAIFTATIFFAFANRVNNTGVFIGNNILGGNRFAIVTYEYTPSAGVPNPPTSQNQCSNTANWTLRTSVPTCNGLGSKFCRIQFDNANCTLQQALDIICNRVQNGQSITHGTTYCVGTCCVTIFLKL